MKIQVFDTETTGLNPYAGARIFAYCAGDVRTGKVTVARIDGHYGTERSKAIAGLKKFFADTGIAKVCHHLKFDLGFILDSHLVAVPEETVFHDTMLMSQCLRNDERSHSLDALCIKYGGREMVCAEDEKVSQWFKQVGSYQKIDPKLMEKYQRADGERTIMLFRTLWPQMEQRGSLAVQDYLNEVALVKVTIDMERVGILYDKEKADELRVRLEREIGEAHQIIQKRYNRGAEINVLSGKQVATLLYKTLGFHITAFTNKGAPSVDKDVLLGMRQSTGHEIFNLLLKYRSYAKALQMLDGYEKNIAPDGRIHPNIKTNHAATGREACDNPNLQNVSKELNEKNPYPVSLRHVFRTDPGYVMLFVDYAGIEMRLIIDATGEPELMGVLKNRADVHRPTMECFVDLPNWSVDTARRSCDGLKERDPKGYKSLRNAYKNTGFCVAYGGGDDKVAFTLGKPLHEVKDGCIRYRQRFSRIARFSSSLAYTVKKTRYITTPFGRRLYVPPEEAYIAANYMIQGTAAGILKRAQVRVHQFIKREFKDRIDLLLPIHDELVMRVSRKMLSVLPDAVKEMSRIMTDMPEIRAPLDVEWKMTTTTWDRAKEFKA